MRRTYTAAVEVATRHELDVTQLAEVLGQYRPSAGTSPRGWLEVRLVLTAGNLGQACSVAVSVAAAATGAEAIACSVMTLSESDDRASDHPVPVEGSGTIPPQRRTLPTEVRRDAGVLGAG